MALIHGGQLQRVAKQFNIAQEHWLDLSTGIAPHSYPIPSIPNHIYQALPQESNNLNIAAKRYYNIVHSASSDILVTNGSQAIIKLLPQLWLATNPTSQIAYLPEQGYKEHALAWQNAGFTIHWYQEDLPPFSAINANSVLVIINPNNPTGKLYPHSLLKQYQKQMAQCGGLLVLDEAFMDVVTPSQSMTSSIDDYTNTLVLRSFGKFFGLAGIRIGFLVADQHWITLFNEQLGPWQVNGPAQFIATKALADEDWHQAQQTRLTQLSASLLDTLRNCLPTKNITAIEGTSLFQTVFFTEQSNVARYYTQLCQQGVYVRLTDDKKALRFGLVKPDQLERLSTALLALRN